jgi:hypothetical protein
LHPHASLWRFLRFLLAARVPGSGARRNGKSVKSVKAAKAVYGSLS